MTYWNRDDDDFGKPWLPYLFWSVVLSIILLSLYLRIAGYFSSTP